MTAFNTDYSKNELLDQELTTAELTEVFRGCVVCTGPVVDPGFNGLPGVGEFLFKEVIKVFYPTPLIAL